MYMLKYIIEMKEILKIVGWGVIGFFSITGYFMNNMEFIPDNAKVYVIEEYKIWIPNAKWTDDIFKEQASGNENTKKSYENKVESVYSEITKGKYEGFELPETWKEQKKEIVWGKQESLLSSWIFSSQNRWNEDGSWNW